MEFSSRSFTEILWPLGLSEAKQLITAQLGARQIYFGITAQMSAILIQHAVTRYLA